MKFLNNAMFALLFPLLCLYGTMDQIQCQNIFRPAVFSNFGSYGWKIPRRPMPRPEVGVISRSSFGYIRGQTISEDIARGKPNTDSFESVGYVPGFEGDINMVKLSNSNDIDSEDPPPHQEVAKMARFIVSNVLWTTLATISTRGATTGSPFTTILSISDGTQYNSTGNLYMYMTPKDLAAMDLEVNANASLVMSLAQTKYCDKQKYDPEDPRCAMVSFSGRVVKVPKGSDEEKFGKAALFYKHPVMKSWPESHEWYVAKLAIGNIIVRDYFGGARTVTPNDYFAANPNTTTSTTP